MYSQCLTHSRDTYNVIPFFFYFEILFFVTGKSLCKHKEKIFFLYNKEEEEKNNAKEGRKLSMDLPFYTSLKELFSK